MSYLTIPHVGMRLRRKPCFEEVLALRGLWRQHPRYHGCVGHWAILEGGGTTLYDLHSGSGNGTITGATWGTSLYGFGLNYDGVDDYVSIPLNLSGTSVVTVAFSMRVDTFSSDRVQGMEFTPDFNTNAGWICYSDSTGTYSMAMNTGVGVSRKRFTRPSTGEFHRYSVVFDAGKAAASEVGPVYVDGVSQSLTIHASNENTANFANSTLYIGSRAGSSVFGACNIDEVRIHSREWSDAAHISWATDPFLEFQWAWEQHFGRLWVVPGALGFDEGALFYLPVMA